MSRLANVNFLGQTRHRPRQNRTLLFRSWSAVDVGVRSANATSAVWSDRFQIPYSVAIMSDLAGAAAQGVNFFQKQHTVPTHQHQHQNHRTRAHQNPAEHDLLQKQPMAAPHGHQHQSRRTTPAPAKPGPNIGTWLLTSIFPGFKCKLQLNLLHVLTWSTKPIKFSHLRLFYMAVVFHHSCTIFFCLFCPFTVSYASWSAFIRKLCNLSIIVFSFLSYNVSYPLKCFQVRFCSLIFFTFDWTGCWAPL